ncbi:MAG: FAD-binding protein, partial [Pseudomonadota bacterium]
MREDSDLTKRLKTSISGDVMADVASRARYATDASIYQMLPKAVVVPRSEEDVETAMTIAREEETTVLPRGGGTSQCGQTVNRGVVLDNT